MKIIALRAENFKRLTSVEIQPDGSLVRLTGRNGQGKSSCLDAIAAALGGKDLCPAVPIRIGSENAEVSVDLGEYVVTRRWTESGSTLTVRTPDGARFPSPQTLLDKIVGRISFDPLAFIRAKPAEQVETLRKLVGLDFTPLNNKRAGLFEDRTDVNREIAQLKGAVARMPAVDAPDEEVSVADLLAEQEKLLGQQRALDEARVKAREASTKREIVQSKLKAAREEVERLEKQLAHAKAAVESWDKAMIEAEQAEDGAGGLCMELTEPDLAAIRQRLAEAEGINAKVRAKKARAAEIAKLAEKEAAAKALTDKIGALDAQKSGALAQAKFPVPGLSFTDDGVTLNGLPIDQASSSEQLRVSVAIGASLNSKLRVLFVRDGSLLDEKSLSLVAEVAESMGLQVWMERVFGRGETGFVIEDGTCITTASDFTGAPDRAATEAR